jgi:hypothetical protein
MLITRAGVNACRIDPYVKLQRELQFTDRLSFYTGAGTVFDTDADHLVQCDELGLPILTP